jgi:hypothetical protein
MPQDGPCLIARLAKNKSHRGLAAHILKYPRNLFLRPDFISPDLSALLLGPRHYPYQAIFVPQAGPGKVFIPWSRQIWTSLCLGLFHG